MREKGKYWNEIHKLNPFQYFLREILKWNTQQNPFQMESAEKRASQPWWVWASIWAGVILSLFTVWTKYKIDGLIKAIQMKSTIMICNTSLFAEIKIFHPKLDFAGDFVGVADGRWLSPLETPASSWECSRLPCLYLTHNQHPNYTTCHRGALAGLHFF